MCAKLFLKHINLFNKSLNISIKIMFAIKFCFWVDWESCFINKKNILYYNFIWKITFKFLKNLVLFLLNLIYKYQYNFRKKHDNIFNLKSK